MCSFPISSTEKEGSAFLLWSLLWIWAIDGICELVQESERRDNEQTELPEVEVTEGELMKNNRKDNTFCSPVDIFSEGFAFSFMT